MCIVYFDFISFGKGKKRRHMLRFKKNVVRVNALQQGKDRET